MKTYGPKAEARLVSQMSEEDRRFYRLMYPDGIPKPGIRFRIRDWWYRTKGLCPCGRPLP